MIKIENVVTPSAEQWEAIIRGTRNPMNSWDKSDSVCCDDVIMRCDRDECIQPDNCNYCIGENDLELMRKLVKAGTDHRKFMRMIVVYADITAPRYWWAEADTYKVGTVRNSCSTMHKITDKEFTIDDFSHEHLVDRAGYRDKVTGSCSIAWFETCLCGTIDKLNFAREKYLETKDKFWWWQIIQLLPSSYNQKATLMLNYEVLANMYHSRKNHKLDCWRTFCKWIETLPYSELITQ